MSNFEIPEDLKQAIYQVSIFIDDQECDPDYIRENKAHIRSIFIEYLPRQEMANMMATEYLQSEEEDGLEVGEYDEDDKRERVP